MSVESGNQYATAVQGIEIWQQLTDTVIVTVPANEVAVYRRLRLVFPKLHIIPSLWPVPILTCEHYDTPKVWETLADAARVACAETGSDMYLIDNEASLQCYQQGKVDFHWPSLVDGLRKLPRDKLLLWYPWPAGTDERTAELCRIVQANCNVRFLDPGLSTPDSREQGGMKVLMEQLRGIGRLPTIPMIYNYTGEQYWPDERVPEALRQVDADMAIVYPGMRRWVESARALCARQDEIRAATSRPAAR